LADEFPQRVDAVRRFNRFYTRQIGVLQEHLLDNPFSLTEARLLYELAHRPQTTATVLGAELGLDPGYLSRTVRSFEKRGLLRKTRAAHDGRQTLLRLTRKGEQAFTRLNAASTREISALLEPHSTEEQERLIRAMSTIERTLSVAAEPRVSYILRPPRPGDFGWVVQRHGTLYSQEYGWDEHFEALVAEIVAKFVQHFDAKFERCWIAERNGENVGSVFVVRKSKVVAQLRLLLVEPSARGLGIGARLVDECIRFARQVGYRKMTLWTNDVLHSARRIYESVGFQLVAEEKHHSWGHDLVSQTWDLTL